jgi:hypothetical protein
MENVIATAMAGMLGSLVGGSATGATATLLRTCKDETNDEERSHE